MILNCLECSADFVMRSVCLFVPYFISLAPFFDASLKCFALTLFYTELNAHQVATHTHRLKQTHTQSLTHTYTRTHTVAQVLRVQHVLTWFVDAVEVSVKLPEGNLIS